MTTEPARVPPFERLKPVLRQLFLFWAKWFTGTAIVTFAIGAVPVLSAMCLLLTLGLPILALALWGRSLDEELGWSDLEQEPW